MPASERPEPQRSPYYRAARFPGEQPAGRAYFQAQEVIYRATACDLSVYRLQLEQRWHVAVLGLRPPRYIERKLERILAAGESVTLPPEVLELLQNRRARATQIGPWVEGHHRPGERL